MADALKPITPEDEAPLDPWERQPGEPSKAFGVFCVYRDLGARRSLKSACKQYYAADYAANKLRNAQEWSRNWEWVRRSAAWDNFLDREARLSQVEAVREMNRRYANTARAVLAKALVALKGLDAKEMDPSDVSRMIEVANKIERLCHGEATEHTKSDIKNENNITLQVVERIVPVRGSTPPALAAPAPVAPAALESAQDAEYELPAEPPPGL